MTSYSDLLIMARRSGKSVRKVHEELSKPEISPVVYAADSTDEGDFKPETDDRGRPMNEDGESLNKDGSVSKNQPAETTSEPADDGKGDYKGMSN